MHVSSVARTYRGSESDARTSALNWLSPHLATSALYTGKSRVSADLPHDYALINAWIRTEGEVVAIEYLLTPLAAGQARVAPDILEMRPAEDQVPEGPWL